MDYLDPKKKRAHARRLYLGYALMAVLISLASLILVYMGSGYDIDRRSGLLYQNGLIYIDSTPSDGTIFLNGRQQSDQTGARLVVPGDTYSISIERDGYRSWRRQIVLEGGKVRRIAYPRLVPLEVTAAVVQTLSAKPDVIIQSLNREFLLMHTKAVPRAFLQIEADNPGATPQTLLLPEAAFVNAEEIGTFTEVEWTANSRYVLLEHTYKKRIEFIVLDREEPSRSFNVTKTFELSQSTQVTFRDRAFDNFVLFDKKAKTVRYAERGEPLADAPLINNVIAMKAFEDDKVLYITESAEAGKVLARLRQGSSTYDIRVLEAGSTYLLDVAKFERKLVVAVGSPVERKVAVYSDPVGYLQDKSDARFPIPTTILRVRQPRYVSFSVDASIVAVYGGAEFATHEFDAEETNQFEVATPFDQTRALRWMDGSRLNFISSRSVHVMDFDGNNNEKLLPGLAEYGTFYDRDFEKVFSFQINEVTGQLQITRASLLVQ